jgi:hypothetical protein
MVYLHSNNASHWHSISVCIEQQYQVPVSPPPQPQSLAFVSFITATHTPNITNSCRCDTVTLRHYVTTFPYTTVNNPIKQNPPSQDDGHSVSQVSTSLLQNRKIITDFRECCQRNNILRDIIPAYTVFL